MSFYCETHVKHILDDDISIINTRKCQIEEKPNIEAKTIVRHSFNVTPNRKYIEIQSIAALFSVRALAFFPQISRFYHINCTFLYGFVALETIHVVPVVCCLIIQWEDFALKANCHNGCSGLDNDNAFVCTLISYLLKSCTSPT